MPHSQRTASAAGMSLPQWMQVVSVCEVCESGARVRATVPVLFHEGREDGAGHEEPADSEGFVIAATTLRRSSGRLALVLAEIREEFDATTPATAF